MLGSRDVQTIAQTLPRQMHWFFKRLAANGYAIEIKNSHADLDRQQGKQNFQLLARALVFGFATMGALGAFYLTQNSTSVFPQLGLAALTLASAWSFYKIMKS